MGKAYPKDIKAKFKARVTALVAKGWSIADIADDVGISSSYAFLLACEEREYKKEVVEKIRYMRYERKPEATFVEIAKELGVGATTVRAILMRSKEEEEKEVQKKIMSRSGKKGAKVRWGNNDEERHKKTLQLRESLKRTREKRRKVLEPEKREAEAEGPPRAVGYIRVSTEEQAKKGISMEVQEKSIRSFADAKEWDLIGCIKDPGISGKDMNRPGMKKVIQMCREHEIKVVIVYKLDRLSRSLRDIFSIVDDVFSKYKVELASVTETIDTSGAMGRGFFWIMAILGQIEREKIGERVRDARRFRAEKGEWTGRPPHGYKMAVDDKGERIKGKVVAVPAELKHYKKAKEMYVAGYSQREIGKKLGFKSMQGSKRLIDTDLKVLRKRMMKFLYKP